MFFINTDVSDHIIDLRQAVGMLRPTIIFQVTVIIIYGSFFHICYRPEKEAFYVISKNSFIRLHQNGLKLYVNRMGATFYLLQNLT